MLFAGQHISKSPFEVEIGMAQGDSSRATAQGPGLEPSGNIANKTTYFDVYTAGNKPGVRCGLFTIVRLHFCVKHLFVFCQVLVLARWRWSLWTPPVRRTRCPAPLRIKATVATTAPTNPPRRVSTSSM